MEVNEVQVNINELIESNTHEGRDGSKLIFENFEIYDRPTFVDYLKAEWNIQMIGAIDFTSNNGRQGDSEFLHNLNEGNRYESCLTNIGSVLDPYSMTKKYTFYGFGADNMASEVFPINGDAE